MAEVKTYVAPHPVYVDRVYVAADTPFTTAAPAGAQWEEYTPPSVEETPDPEVELAAVKARNAELEKTVAKFDPDGDGKPGGAVRGGKRTA